MATHAVLPKDRVGSAAPSGWLQFPGAIRPPVIRRVVPVSEWFEELAAIEGHWAVSGRIGDRILEPARIIVADWAPFEQLFELVLEGHGRFLVDRPGRLELTRLSPRRLRVRLTGHGDELTLLTAVPLPAAGPTESIECSLMAECDASQPCAMGA